MFLFKNTPKADSCYFLKLYFKNNAQCFDFKTISCKNTKFPKIYNSTTLLGKSSNLLFLANLFQFLPQFAHLSCNSTITLKKQSNALFFNDFTAL